MSKHPIPATCVEKKFKLIIQYYVKKYKQATTKKIEQFGNITSSLWKFHLASSFMLSLCFNSYLLIRFLFKAASVFTTKIHTKKTSSDRKLKHQSLKRKKTAREKKKVKISNLKQ